MGMNSKIEWCDHTINLWHGCTKAHAGCDHCYAETLSRRWKHDVWGNDKPRLYVSSALDDLYKMQSSALKKGVKESVFIGSMMDIFEKPMPLVGRIKGTNEVHAMQYYDEEKQEWFNELTEYYREQLFGLITKNDFPNLIFLFLTKRPSNINKYIPEIWRIRPPDNVMFGTSPCDQETFDNLVPQLMRAPGKHFLSIEPMLGPVNVAKELPVGKGTVPMGLLMDWIIVGGESGPGKRPMNAQWAREVRDACKILDTPFFMKQIDKVQPIPPDLMIREFPEILTK